MIDDPIRNWNDAVRKEAHRLHGSGMPPQEAIQRALDNVSAARRKKVADRIANYSREEKNGQ